MTPDAGASGVVPKLGAEELAASLPGLASAAELSTHTLFQLPSASIGPLHVLAALHWAGAQIQAGADGVVLTQGTDSIEETAYLLDLYWPFSRPLVVTGAMRAPTTAGADGPANLLAAVVTAGARASHRRGVLVVMNDEVHAARWVRKSHSLAVQAFSSPETGPLGRLVEGRLHYFAPPASRPVPLPVHPALQQQAHTLLEDSGLGPPAAQHPKGRAHSGAEAQTGSTAVAAAHQPPAHSPPATAARSELSVTTGTTFAPCPRVALLESWLGDDGHLAELAVRDGYDGLVIAGFGAGHLSFEFAQRFDALCAQVPVVVASRTAAGPTTTATYGYVGSEVDLMRRGALMSGWLPARKARALLWALLVNEAPREQLAAKWQEYAQLPR